MAKRFYLLSVYTICFTFLICGCAGQTKPHIPSYIPPKFEGMARIVATRELQMSGAAVPIKIIDIGEEAFATELLYAPELHPFVGTWIDEVGTEMKVDAFGEWALIHPEKIGGKPIKSGVWHITKKNDRENIDLKYSSGDLPFIMKCKLTFPDKNTLNLKTMLGTTTMKRRSSVNPPLTINLSNGTLVLVSNEFGQPEVKRVQPLGARNSILNLIHRQGHAYQNFSEIGKLRVGETLIWDRTPGRMRLSAIWHDGLEPLSKELHVEAGKIYFLHHTTRLSGERWEVKKEDDDIEKMLKGSKTHTDSHDRTYDQTFLVKIDALYTAVLENTAIEQSVDYQGDKNISEQTSDGPTRKTMDDSTRSPGLEEARLLEEKLSRIGNNRSLLYEFTNHCPFNSIDNPCNIAKQRIENLEIEAVRKQGVGDRVIIANIVPPKDRPTGKSTLYTNGNYTLLQAQYSDDAVPIMGLFTRSF